MEPAEAPDYHPLATGEYTQSSPAGIIPTGIDGPFDEEDEYGYYDDGGSGTNSDTAVSIGGRSYGFADVSHLPDDDNGEQLF